MQGGPLENLQPEEPQQSSFRTVDYPPDPYPGARPGVSFAELGGRAWVVRPESAGWAVEGRGTDLDVWLAMHDAPPVAARLPVLAYGSNACPGKLDWLRAAMGLAGPAVVLEADVRDAAAVWSAGHRARDGQRPAVLVAAPGVTERHAVWLATEDQRAVLDLVEGRGERHRLAWVHTPVTLPGGSVLDRVLAYLSLPGTQHLPPWQNRSPLLVDGAFVRVAELGQHDAHLLTGSPAESDGLTTTPV